MKRTLFQKFIPIILFSSLIYSGCKKEEVIPEVIPPATEVNLFVWTGLSDYYLWNDLITQFSDKKYEKKDSLNSFLNKYVDPQKLFSTLLYKPNEVDKWSFLVDNSKKIEDWISGISETMGYDFMLGRIGTTGDLFGFVRYVYKDSPAEKAGIKRGDIFLNVNDQQLNLTNYQTLLFATLTYKLGFATISNNTIYPNSRTVTMTAVTMQENPINKDTIFTFNNQKIGYLVYNGFNADFDIQLNDIFKKFKDANINQMVLDLRYNGGGSVKSSIYLASMIYGTDKTKIFARSHYNSGLQNYFVSQYGSESLNDFFVGTIDQTSKNPATPINTLNLKKIYIIVSGSTASASELLINGLKPLMNVVVIGANTNGKYTGSMTVKDWDVNGVVNPRHTWTMQPIVVKYANSLGVSDFVNGLTPNITASEDIANLLPFGNPNETLLKVVLDDIKGAPITSMVLKSAQIGIVKVAESQDFKPFAREMYIDPAKFRDFKNK